MLPALLIPLVVAAACWGEEETSTPEPTVGPQMTLEDIYSRLAEAISRPGFVFHMTYDLDLGDSKAVRIEAWVDVQRQLARHEFRPSPALIEYADVAEYVSIVADDTEYFRNPDRSAMHPARTCLDADSPALSTVLGCEFFPEEATARVETGVQYEGRAALALVTEGTSEGSEEALTSYASRLYLDETSFLPLARVTKSMSDGETTELVLPYDVEFLPTDSLPQDIFDPAAIGFVEEDPAAALDGADLGITIYWLGREFPGESGLPSLVLARSYATTTPGSSPGHYAQIEYETTQGSVAVLLLLWRLEDWEAFLETPLGRLWWDSPCVERKDIQLDGGRAVIFMGYEPERELLPGPVAITPGEPLPTPTAQPSPTSAAMECPAGRDFDRFLAHAYVNDTVVAVNAPLCLYCARRGTGPDPYDSLEGMEAILRGLRPR